MTVKHGTSSVFVFARLTGGWRVGLIQHPRFARLMLPGGHIEPYESPAEAALREVAEETGLAVRLLPAPSVPLPGSYHAQRVMSPWWMAEYRVPPDNHAAAAHAHIDHLYVSLADNVTQVTTPAHPFGWYAAAGLPGLSMFPDAMVLAATLLTGINGVPPGGGDAALVSAMLARLRASAAAPG